MMYDSLEEARDAGVAPWKDVLQEDFHVVIYKDKYPVTEDHLLFVPQYPTDGVIEECFSDALAYGKIMVASGSWDGFNIGMNWGVAAGQTVMYPHVHLIPRRKGDVEDPRGGVRHVIPGKGNYKNE
jgi:diadenosine tetraphosphate (Ap4A) HIT family hydrolase